MRGCWPQLSSSLLELGINLPQEKNSPERTYVWIPILDHFPPPNGCVLWISIECIALKLKGLSHEPLLGAAKSLFCLFVYSNNSYLNLSLLFILFSLLCKILNVVLCKLISSFMILAMKTNVKLLILFLGRVYSAPRWQTREIVKLPVFFFAIFCCRSSHIDIYISIYIYSFASHRSMCFPFPEEICFWKWQCSKHFL